MEGKIIEKYCNNKFYIINGIKENMIDVGSQTLLLIKWLLHKSKANQGKNDKKRLKMI